MTQEGQVPPPPVLWAQERNNVFVTFCLEDCKDPTIKIEPTTVYFKGVGGTDKKLHEVTINLYEEIVPNSSIQTLTGRTIELVLRKKGTGPFWPRLMKDNTKAHWLKCDFNKWNDDDETDEEMEGEGMQEVRTDLRNLSGKGSAKPSSAEALMSQSNDYFQLMKQMGELGALGENKPNFEDLGDSDDDDMPDLI